jgi:hypothetical protein
LKQLLGALHSRALDVRRGRDADLALEGAGEVAGDRQFLPTLQGRITALLWTSSPSPPLVA